MDKRVIIKEILWRPGVGIVLTLYGLLQLISNKDAFGDSHLVTCDREEWKQTGEIRSKYEEEMLQWIKEQKNEAD